MKKIMSRKAGSGSAGKKILFALAAFLLLAAGCNSKQQPAMDNTTGMPAQSPQAQQPPAPLSGNAKVDTALKDILNSEQAASVTSVDCSTVTGPQFISLGDGIMGWLAGDETHHSAMEKMMGGEASDMTNSAHAKLGKIYLNCPQNSRAMANSGSMGQAAANSDMGGGKMTSDKQMAMKSMGDMDMVAIKQNGNLGEYITDPNGATLYTYANDTAGSSSCYDSCQTAWPPYATMLDAAKISSTYQNLSVVKRKDGSMQLAWKGMPLYYFSKDKNPGDAMGQGVASLWQVVKP